METLPRRAHFCFGPECFEDAGLDHVGLDRAEQLGDEVTPAKGRSDLFADGNRDRQTVGHHAAGNFVADPDTTTLSMANSLSRYCCLTAIVF
jgi:hypothetical protein